MTQETYSTAAQALLTAVPYASDPNGVFSTSDAITYLTSLGYSKGAAANTVFKWSDPTDRRGLRRYRRTQRMSAAAACEKPLSNRYSGEGPIPKEWGRRVTVAVGVASGSAAIPEDAPPAQTKPLPSPSSPRPTPAQRSKVDEALETSKLAMMVSVSAMIFVTLVFIGMVVNVLS